MGINMKRPKKVVIWTLILIIFAFFSFSFIYQIVKDETRLTPAESEWVNDNLNKVLNVSVLNDTNVFGSDGTGVFFDFLNDFTENYNLKFNTITYNSIESASGIVFGISNTLQDNIEFYQDHYVLVSKTNSFLTLEQLKSKKVGILKDSMVYVGDHLDDSPTFIGFDSRKELLEAFEKKEEIEVILVPRIEYMDTILKNDYRIIHHFTNISRYYYLKLEEENNAVLSSILKKYFGKWKENDFNETFHQEEFQLFVKSLNITQADVDQLQSIVYNYGFINNSPYEILTGGNYGGIIASYLSEFSLFSKIEFNFKRYKNYKKLVSAIQDNKVDLYFGYQNFTAGGSDILTDLQLTYDVLVPLSNDMVVSSLKSLKGRTVYVENNSLLQSKLNSLSLFQVETYEGEKGLKEVVKNQGIVMIDHNISTFYQSHLLKNYIVRYTGHFSESYVFKSHTNGTFVQLFTRYIDYLDENKMNYVGLYNHNVTIKNGTILGTIAKYFLYIFIGGFFLFYFVYRSSKRVRLANRIKREDKMKFIDQLTSLKNRNYLNENFSKWNKNTIYPQTVIVIDLNRIQEINDTIGYEEGDSQIKAAANIFVKTQLDNSDIIRTDGNEFLIYLIGYQTKQITAYIHKLNKELKNLPYSYGACIGYSMIVDDIKSLEDAINEAIEDVKKQKQLQKEELDS
jgi:diguanylate cyclase (GGDEF)-like protein